jgi:hypothetical protein
LQHHRGEGVDMTSAHEALVYLDYDWSLLGLGGLYDRHARLEIRDIEGSDGPPGLAGRGQYLLGCY